MVFQGWTKQYIIHAIPPPSISFGIIKTSSHRQADQYWNCQVWERAFIFFTLLSHILQNPYPRDNIIHLVRDAGVDASFICKAKCHLLHSQTSHERKWQFNSKYDSFFVPPSTVLVIHMKAIRKKVLKKLDEIANVIHSLKCNVETLRASKKTFWWSSCFWQRRETAGRIAHK